jgi:stage V sporulation protein G
VEITEVRIKLMEDASERLQAFCSITFDDAFVVRDLKIIEGTNGPFVAMPSRKLTAHCPQCGCKNHLRAQFCNQCGTRQRTDRAALDDEGRAKLYADIAHPINSMCREMIQERVIHEFHLEQDRAKQPGYVSRYEDFDHDHDDVPALRRDAAARGADRPAYQAAERQPRGPHRPPASASAPARVQHPPQSIKPNPPASVPPGNSHPKPGRDNFGAGIF